MSDILAWLFVLFLFGILVNLIGIFIFCQIQSKRANKKKKPKL